MSSPAEGRTVVVALGGNAITAQDETGTHAEMLARCEVMATSLAGLASTGWRVVLTHGNGPQVGNLSLQQGAAEPTVPAQPLSSLVAMTQGWLGGMIELAVRNSGAVDLPAITTVVTHVVVDPDDPAFAHPTKPIGPFYDAAAAQERSARLGWQMIEDSGRGYRRVVASPRPVSIVESDAISLLAASGHVVIAAGGGGIPVARNRGRWQAVDAVVDKDRAAAILATSLRADALLLVTGVDVVELDFGRPTQRAIREVTAAQMERFLADGQFPPGSMGPKVEAAIDFLAEQDGQAIITSAGNMVAALEGRAGTRIRRAEVRV